MTRYDTMQPHALSVVGLGPGDPGLLPPLARAALEKARILVGYAAYMDLLPDDLKEGKTIRTTGMRGERERALFAIGQARAGIPTALVASGDPGIYALAGLVLEMLRADNTLDLDLTIIPGITALSAAASRLGAPIAHDFASISLSDLLTPWERIEKRVEAALAADFVLVLYNPRSRGRPDHIAKVFSLALQYRSPDCPVGLVRNAYRKDEATGIYTLATVPVESIDMLTTVLVGNNETLRAGPYMITPRGYGDVCKFTR